MKQNTEASNPANSLFGLMKRLRESIETLLDRPTEQCSEHHPYPFHILHLFGGGFGEDTLLQEEEPITLLVDDDQVMVVEEEQTDYELRGHYPDYSEIQASEARLKAKNPEYFSQQTIEAGLAESKDREERDDILAPWNYVNRERFLRPPQ
jgi:hypothetical protein